MLVVESYFVAVVMCVVTMICWGSWANTQKLATKKWPFQLYYWDYAIGVVLLSLIFAFTLGSFGSAGRSFLPDLRQATFKALSMAFLGGVIFNLSNILLVAAIDIAGMAVAFPIGVGLALVIGVIMNYVATPLGNPVFLFIGVGLVVVAVIVDALAYKRLPNEGQKTTAKGIGISIAAGILMGFFYRFVAASMSTNFAHPEVGLMTPYTAVVIFSLGLFISNFVWNSIMMVKPFVGEPVPFADYFKKGNPRLHLIGILGGIIWGIGMSLNIIAAGPAGFAISYGLGQGAPMVAAFWGVFIWKEFKDAPVGTNKLLNIMFVCFIIGLLMIIAARVV
ncbi:MAG: multidrug DMT transporter permease [Candidatus Marinimicrobia bacterium]|nr:multidrug DMT transporter permease [Candidatus Neomarinimicrobiota bacterium]